MTMLQPPDLAANHLPGASAHVAAAAWLRALGSLRFTPVALLLLAVGVVAAYKEPRLITWGLVLPLALVALNLAASIVVQPAFRRQMPLLVFHLALLAIVLLAALGRLTYLKGRVEIAEGRAFDGTLGGFEAGPFHPWGLRDLRFINEGFRIDYQPGRQRDHTRNRISYENPDGTQHSVVIGDQVPLVLGGYRFYTSFNKGFALVFYWTDANGAVQRGQVHLPAYPLHEYRQTNTWTPPGAATELWMQLRIEEPLLAAESAAEFRTPRQHTLVVRAGGRRAELKPGMGVRLDGGFLRYEGIRSWMGYRVHYDPTLPWMLAACAVAVLSLGWHLWRKVGQRPWQSSTVCAENAP